MQTNYYFLRQLVGRLQTELNGLVLAECFSQEKDELVLGFCTPQKQWRKKRDFYIRATVRPDFVCLSFPEEFRRANKNSANLFAELIDAEVTGIRQFLNERCFAVDFSKDLSEENADTEKFTLLFKLHGNRSNLILFREEEPIDFLHNKLVADQNLSLNTLDRAIDQSKEGFMANGLKATFPTLGKEITGFLNQNGFQQAGQEAQWAMLSGVLVQINKPVYHLKTIEYQPTLLLFDDKINPIDKKFDDPLEAANYFFSAFTRINVFEKEKGQIVRELSKRKEKLKSYTATLYDKLSGLETEVKNEEIGHILMANLHQIPERTERIELYDFYRDKPINIKLKVDLSAQRNAEVYYRKAKNEKIEIDFTTEQIENREQELLELEQQIAQVEAIETLKLLRKHLKDNNLTKPEKIEVPLAEQFKKVVFEGFEIFIGRNSKNNDVLTQRFARKEDLWLHARDVAGSHVVVRRQAGKAFPKTVIERAAALAAHFSKRKNDSLCPVIVTPKKYVRKTRDLHEGQVIIDKEEVVLVVPEGI
jgi:predicted ribosome quality control (RQC) complex YloA/Tae2 family protein